MATWIGTSLPGQLSITLTTATIFKLLVSTSGLMDQVMPVVAE
jgi:hypothetical protein